MTHLLKALMAASGASRILYYDPCESLSAWTDLDTGDGATTQAAFSSEETFKSDAGTAGGGNFARIRRTDALTMPNKAIITIRLYHATLGTIANTDYFQLNFQDSTNSELLTARFGTDGLFIVDDASSVEVGTNIVSTGQWDVYKFVVDFSGSTVDVYQNSVLQGSALALRTVSIAANTVQIDQFGNTTANTITYTDFLQIEQG